ncbi:MAG: phytoene desaturase family protein [Promethearchaeota archaeon]
MKEDVIVIGSGIGGLSCAALLAHGGHKVTVFEKNPFIGGACSSYIKKGYTFDRAVHLFTSGLNGPYGILFKRLGLDTLQFIKHINERTAMKIYKQKGFFPFDINVNSLFKTMKPVPKKEGESDSKSGSGGSSIMKGLKSMGVGKDTLKDFSKVMTNLMTMSKRKIKQLYEDGLTVTEWLNNFTEDSFIHGILAFLLAGMFAISPRKASAAEFIHCFKAEMMSPEGYQYPVSGGAQGIPNAIADAIKKYGGEIRTESRVDNIVIKGGKVQGVMVKGELIEAPIVISNLDIRMTVLNLIGKDYLDKVYLNKIEKLEPSLSSMTFKLALKEPIIKNWGFINCYHPTLMDYADKYPPDKGYPFSNGFFGPVLSNIDSNLAPPGGQSVIFGTIVPSKGPDWKKWQEVYWEDLHSFFPDLDDKLLFFDVSFPKDLTEATGKPAGPVEGLALSPEQTGKNKPSSVIPGIEGLFVVGDTAGKDAHGIGTQLACDSGIKCADVILGLREANTI